MCAAVFFAGMFYLGCGLGSNGRGGDQDNRLVAAQVGDLPVYYDDLSKMIEQQRQQAIMQNGRATSPEALSPLDEAQIQSGVLTEVIGENSAYYLALKAGVKFTDQVITKEEEKNFDQETMMTRMQLVQANKLKPDATDKDFDAVLKKEQGMTLSERKTQFHQRLVEVLKDPKTRPQLEMSLAKTVLLDSISASINPSLAELKATYDSYQFKRILFAAHPGSTVDAQIAKAQADLKSGLTFEQAIDRYSSESPIKGKKLSENDINIQADSFDTVTEYKPLKSMKPGQVSDVIQTAQGKAIYKLIGIKNMAPPDLEKGKAKYQSSYVGQKANTELTEKLKAFQSSNAIVWKIPALKALYDWAQVKQDPTISPAQLPVRMAAIVDEAKKASTSTQSDSRPALFAWYAAFDTIWTAPGADKAKLRPDRIELLKAITASQPYFSLKLELVDLLIEVKAGDEAVQVLTAAASSNFMYDVEGQHDFQEVQAKMMKLKDAGMLKPADEQAIEKIQQEWLKQNEVAAQEKAEQKKQEAAAQKEAADNAAKQKAATEKEKADAEKAGKGAKPAGPTPKVSVNVPGVTATVKQPPAAPGKKQ